MRSRAAGGLEPDDDDQRELVELWHVSRTALAGQDASRSARINWVVGTFVDAHPDAGRKWVYVWAEAHLGRLLQNDDTPYTVRHRTRRLRDRRR